MAGLPDWTAPHKRHEARRNAPTPTKNIKEVAAALKIGQRVIFRTQQPNMCKTYTREFWGEVVSHHKNGVELDWYSGSSPAPSRLVFTAAHLYSIRPATQEETPQRFGASPMEEHARQARARQNIARNSW